MKKKVIAIISILILACVTILTFTTKSEGFTQYQNGLTWYYEVVDGEAVMFMYIVEHQVQQLQYQQN